MTGPFVAAKSRRFCWIYASLQSRLEGIGKKRHHNETGSFSSYSSVLRPITPAALNKLFHLCSCDEVALISGSNIERFLYKVRGLAKTSPERCAGGGAEVHWWGHISRLALIPLCSSFSLANCRTGVPEAQTTALPRSYTSVWPFSKQWSICKNSSLPKMLQRH